MMTWHESWEIELLRHAVPPARPCLRVVGPTGEETGKVVDVVSLDTVIVCGEPDIYRLVASEDDAVEREVFDTLRLPGHWRDNHGRSHTIHRDGRWEFRGTEQRFRLIIESVTVEGSHNVITFANLAGAATIFGEPDSVNDMIKPIVHGFGFVRDMTDDSFTFYRLRPALGLVFGAIDGPAPLLHLRRAP